MREMQNRHEVCPALVFFPTAALNVYPSALVYVTTHPSMHPQSLKEVFNLAIIIMCMCVSEKGLHVHKCVNCTSQWHPCKVFHPPPQQQDTYKQHNGQYPSVCVFLHMCHTATPTVTQPTRTGSLLMTHHHPTTSSFPAPSPSTSSILPKLFSSISPSVFYVFSPTVYHLIYSFDPLRI